eukprot:TRINITY_DN13269_c0_g1_i2.p3 TRINITY_DN13269_c0_g1~~TRINITY_DN13269_c0_g1_i2.p3  ORF type:complete len:435 (-),score=127.98 TRINITY_DN13269_c0_g1_i2:3931-5235(-)
MSGEADKSNSSSNNKGLWVAGTAAIGVASIAIACGWWLLSGRHGGSKTNNNSDRRYSSLGVRSTSLKVVLDDDKSGEDDSKDVPSALKQQLNDVCEALLCPEGVTFAQLGLECAVKVVRGGITNALFRCKFIPSSSSTSAVGAEYKGPKIVVVRVYGAKTELIIERERENRVGELLAAAGFGKKIYGHFDGGRVEEWLEGNTLKPEEMTDPRFISKIGAKLAEMHLVKVKDPLIPEGTQVWNTLDKWYGIASKVDFEENEKKVILASLNLKQIGEELKNIKAILDKRPPSPVVFAHNDLLSGNVFFSDKEEINFIDFEYGAFNPRAFDIANHFCECCGFDCDWDQFPSKDKQAIFFKAYLSSWKKTTGDFTGTVTQEEIDALYEEVRPWALVSHLFWGIWAVVQAKYSPIEFDFINYSKLRITGFHQHKPRFLD